MKSNKEMFLAGSAFNYRGWYNIKFSEPYDKRNPSVVGYLFSHDNVLIIGTVVSVDDEKVTVTKLYFEHMVQSELYYWVMDFIENNG